MAVLNQNFGGSKTGFGFTLTGVTRTDNAAWFYADAGRLALLPRIARRGPALAGPHSLWSWRHDLQRQRGDQS